MVVYFVYNFFLLFDVEDNLFRCFQIAVLNNVYHFENAEKHSLRHCFIPIDGRQREKQVHSKSTIIFS